MASLSGSVGTRLFLETKVQTSRETRPRDAAVRRSAGADFRHRHVRRRPVSSEHAGHVPLSGVSRTSVYVRGKHDVKFGADYNAFNMRNNSFALGLNGAYMFPTLEAFIARQPLLYAQNFGLNGYTAQEAALLKSFWQHEAAVYVQDRFRPTSRLTIGLGLRYDMQINPQPQAGIAGVQVPVGMPVIAGNQVQLTYAPVPQGIPHDRNNWGPRTRRRLPASGRRVDDGEGLGRSVLRADADDLLSAARRRRQQHHAVCAGLALRRHLPGSPALGHRARLGPRDARGSAGHSRMSIPSSGIHACFSSPPL